jgi:anti-sigma regulatory factor (Ser/Thr protein kinase)
VAFKYTKCVIITLMVTGMQGQRSDAKGRVEASAGGQRKKRDFFKFPEKERIYVKERKRKGKTVSYWDNYGMMVSRIDNRIGRVLKATGVSKKRIENIQTSVIEVVANAVEHGNKHDPKKPVEISYELSLDPFVFTIAVKDFGTGIPEGAMKVKEGYSLEERGRGTTILVSFVNLLEVTSTPSGTTVRMTFVEKPPKARDEHDKIIPENEKLLAELMRSSLQPAAVG